ncbi:helix-turn-helix domain-containing protein [Streptomyces sp. NPDC021224]|uniref:helix-turn-helix domain-containing protein n=1 Tax=unclassified Streptomyces TaxID=2593676 RepID=UPI0037876FFB
MLLRLARLPGPPSAPAGPGTGRSAEPADHFRDLTARPGPAPAPARWRSAPASSACRRVICTPRSNAARACRPAGCQAPHRRHGLTITQVSVSVGFADPAYFCRFFRRETGGLSPGEFRRAVSPRPDGGA